MQKKIYICLCIFTTVVLLIWAWQDVSFPSVITAIRRVDYKWLVLGLFTFLLSFSIRAYRWGTLLSDHPNQGSFHIRHAAVFIGFAANQVLPANAGELVRCGILKKFSGLSLSSCLGSLVAARLLDATVALVFLITPLVSTSGRVNQGLGGFSIVGLISLLPILVVGIGTAAHHPQHLSRTIEALMTHIGFGHVSTQMGQRAERFLSGLTIFRSIKRLGVALLQTVAIWSVSGITFWVTLIAFGLYTPGFMGAMFVQSTEAMATIIPSTPGHLGAFEAAIRFGLSFYSVPPADIVAYTLLLRLLMNGGVMVVGVLFALHLGLTTSDVLSETSKRDQL